MTLPKWAKKRKVGTGGKTLRRGEPEEIFIKGKPSPGIKAIRRGSPGPLENKEEYAQKMKPLKRGFKKAKEWKASFLILKEKGGN